MSAESQTLNGPETSDVVNDEDNVQLSMAPHVQMYLAQVSQESGCWGRYLPIPFERAAGRSWWDPTFDSEILEEQFNKSASSHNQIKFRYALGYILLLSLSWFIYFFVTGIYTSRSDWPLLCAGPITLSLISIGVLFLTRTQFYLDHMLTVSLNIALTMCFVSLAFVILIPKPSPNAPAYISPLGHFSVCTEILLLIYTVIPLRLYASIIIAVTYSILFELLTWFRHELEYETITFVVRLLSHVCIHLIGVHILIMTNARMRNTFMKVGQSLLVRKQLESEKKLKENMIHSLMPPSVAHWLLNDDEHFTRNGMVEHRNSNPETTTTGADSEDIETLFRPFNMNRMENVSILFADIVGFTKISGSKTAEQLVEILNDLFQRFDLLCKQNNCEKISTLGDCYYCVSGCPEARPDHARCCVEMGLAMIQSIRQFDQERNEGVNMRVGVHTGTILCGIVGTCRFKFDVWSNDVTLANRMESTGKPGMVHISESTAKFLQGMYVLEDGEPVFGLRTYFILSRRTLTDRPSSYNGSLRNSSVSSNTNQLTTAPAPQHLLDKTPNTTSLQFIVSPPTSPPSMSPQTRPRVLSCDTPSLLKPHSHCTTTGGRNPNQLSPDVCKIKANSLPSILDSENEQQEADVERESDDNEQVQTPTSTASSGRYSVKIKNWKMPRFLRKTSEPNKETTSAAVAEISSDAHSSSNNEESSTGYHQVPMIVETTPSNHSNMDDYSDPTQIILTPPNPGNLTADDEQTDTIDVKSYISQSRSDIGQYEYGAGDFTQFIRTGSYRSQYGCPSTKDYFLTRAGSNRSRRGKSPNYECIVPSERSRSATVNVIQLEHHRPKKQSLDVPSRLSIIIIDDQQSMTGPSINSRKDSGIRSNSRRSSIQPIDHHMPPKIGNSHIAHLPNNSDIHRVSGYYTSSQSSTLTLPHHLSHLQHMTRLPGPFFGKSIQSLRKQSDRQLIKCVQDNTKSRSSYFMKPPLSQPTLFFKDKYIEEQYRANVHAMYEHREPIPTLANSKFNTYFDVFVSAVVFALISTALFVLYEPSVVWIIFFCLFMIIQLASIALCVKRVVEFSENTLSCISRWYRWNCFGGVLVSLPLCSVLVNFSCSVVFSDYIYSYLLLVGIIHYCNFTQLNCWMKSILCTIFAAIFLSLSIHAPCTIIVNKDFYESSATNSTDKHHRAFQFSTEILMDIVLLMILVWGLNREFEIYYRDGFHTNFVATRDKFHVQSLKNQADWLIYNIVPQHVAEQLKQDAKYSENFKDVAIIFASIVNFNEMYDESYLGGKEFLRVLNELIGDFDELLNIPEFHCVEKIKTIGSTFMAASGLNSTKRLEQQDPKEHLYALMDFAIAMHEVITNFNRDLLEFNLILRIGYNFGDVTAAVIGQTKLYYDIWGDAVNIASRMDSTGVNGRIQVGEHCLPVLAKRYHFEQRGSVYVKGKDNMNVYLLNNKIEDAD